MEDDGFCRHPPQNPTELFLLGSDVNFAVNRQSIHGSHDAVFPVFDEAQVFADVQLAIGELGIVAVLRREDHDAIAVP